MAVQAFMNCPGTQGSHMRQQLKSKNCKEKRLGRKLLTSFALKQLYLRLGNSVSGDSLQKLQPDGLVIWLLLKCHHMCVCGGVYVCAKVHITSRTMIQTDVNTTQSDQSSLFDDKCGCRAGGVEACLKS